tara:strand:+ start:6736 stop:6876 length:141 start_codon:yes stop_codon:yes gene_type:complete
MKTEKDFCSLDFMAKKEKLLVEPAGSLTVTANNSAMTIRKYDIILI